MKQALPPNPHLQNSYHHSPSSSQVAKQQIRYSCGQFSVLQVQACNIIHCLNVYSWRFKTYLPIVRPIRYALNTFQELNANKQQKMANRFHSIFQKLLSSKTDNEKQGLNYIKNHPQMKTYDVYVQMEKIIFQLRDIDRLPLPQIIYLLKEIMVGYEVLVDIFGMLHPDDSMIMVNEHHQWKVWISHQIQFTETHSIHMTERQFIYKLIVIAQDHCVNTSLSSKFFAEIKQFTYSQDCTFARIINKIRQFATNHRIANINKVVIDGHYSCNKTLTKKKGFYQFQQMKSSLVGGKFIPKQDIDDNSQKETIEGQISPQRRMKPFNNNETPINYKDNTNLSTHDKGFSQYQYFTPRQRINLNSNHVFSPQIQNFSSSYNKTLINSFPVMLLNNTTQNSIIQKRRKSHYNERCNSSNQKQPQNPSIIRQIKYNNDSMTKQTVKNSKNSKEINKDSVSLITMSKLKESIRTDNPYTSNYNNLKKNDWDYHYKNLQNSYLNFSINNKQENKQEKSLSISHHFGVAEFDRKQPPSQKSSQVFLKHTISGLFSNSAPIRQLKTSIKLKSPSEIQEQQRYLSDINLEMLSKMGRHAKRSFIKQEESSTAGHIEQSIESGQIKDYNKSQEKGLKDSQEQSSLLKANKPKNQIVFGKNCVFLFKSNQLKVQQEKPQ